MQIKFLNKILDGVKKENGKKEENMESLQEEKKALAGNENNTDSETKQKTEIKKVKKIKNDTKKESDEIIEEVNEPMTVSENSEYVIPVIKESLVSKDLNSADESQYFSKKRKELVEKAKKGRRETKKVRFGSKAVNNVIHENDSNSKRFILRESKLIEKGTEAMVFNPPVKTVARKENTEFNLKDYQSKNKKEAIKKSANRVDRDSTLFVISTLRRLIDEERFITAEAETENMFSLPGKKSSKSKTPLTRSRVTEIKRRKTGTRHPKPDKKVVITKLDSENYNLDKTVGKAAEIYKAYHIDWL